jgi:hypothetical protein
MCNWKRPLYIRWMTMYSKHLMISFIQIRTAVRLKNSFTTWQENFQRQLKLLRTLIIFSYLDDNRRQRFQTQIIRRLSMQTTSPQKRGIRSRPFKAVTECVFKLPTTQLIRPQPESRLIRNGYSKLKSNRTTRSKVKTCGCTLGIRHSLGGMTFGHITKKSWIQTANKQPSHRNNMCNKWCNTWNACGSSHTPKNRTYPFKWRLTSTCRPAKK